MNHLTSFLLISLCFLACEKREKVYDKNDVRKAAIADKPHRIYPSEFYQETIKIGDSLASISQMKLQKALTTALGEGGPTAAEFCNIHADSVLGNQNLIRYKRTSLNYRNAKNIPTAKEKEILEAYAFSLEKKEKLGNHVEQLNDTTYAFYKPIIMKEACLACHGTKDTNVKKETYELLQKKYPTDMALNYKTDDLRGMWVLEIPKVVLVNSIISKKPLK